MDPVKGGGGGGVRGPDGGVHGREAPQLGRGGGWRDGTPPAAAAAEDGPSPVELLEVSADADVLLHLEEVADDADVLVAGEPVQVLPVLLQLLPPPPPPPPPPDGRERALELRGGERGVCGHEVVHRLLLLLLLLQLLLEEPHDDGVGLHGPEAGDAHQVLDALAQGGGHRQLHERLGGGGKGIWY